ncbi:ABC transporter permease [Actinomycetes bacterium KLBMP 9797]
MNSTPTTNSTPSLARLTAIELRKMTDTRAGFWLLAVTALGYAALVIVMIFAADPADLTFWTLFQMTMIPSGILLPVLGILAVTSEWTQRTALTTFTLVPVRGRVITAKIAAALLLAAGSIALGAAVAAAGNVAGAAFADGDGSWRVAGDAVPLALLAQVINVVMGVAFGAALINSALAIVVYFMLPTLWGVLFEMIKALREPAEWLDLGKTLTPLTDGTIAGDQWPKLAVSVAVWVALPLALGTFRTLHREIT